MGTTNPSPTALTTPNVTNASVSVAGANPTRAGLYVFNPNAAVTLWVSPTGTAAAVNGAGSISIAAGTGIMFGPPSQPAWDNGMNAIASSAGTNAITILEFYP